MDPRTKCFLVERETLRQPTACSAYVPWTVVRTTTLLVGSLCTVKKKKKRRRRKKSEKKQATLGDAALQSSAHWRPPQHISFAHFELQRMCARRKCAVPQVCRLLVHGNQAHRPIHQGHHWLAERERQESVALHTFSKEDVIGPCRKRRHLTQARGGEEEEEKKRER